MNKKQLNTLSASLSKALSPPSRKKIELSARIIDQIQPLPGIVSRAANTEPEQKPFPPQLSKTTSVYGSASHQKAIISGVPSPARLPSTHSHLVPLTEQSDPTAAPAKTFLRQRIVRIQRVQDGLTMVEQRILNYLWEKAEKESSTSARVVQSARKVSPSLPAFLWYRFERTSARWNRNSVLKKSLPSTSPNTWAGPTESIPSPLS
jgi:hypothetical protein